jgi:hypothetical protein
MRGEPATALKRDSSAPGHHQTMIQSLPHTLGVTNDTWIVLDALRKKRNLNDYTGAPLSETEAEEAIRQAEALLERLQAHLRKQHPHLIR